jgi:uncharacterized protein YhhL (DUF1145 family)
MSNGITNVFGVVSVTLAFWYLLIIPVVRPEQQQEYVPLFILMGIVGLVFLIVIPLMGIKREDKAP